MLIALLVTTILAAPPQMAKINPHGGEKPVRFTATGTFSDGTTRVFQVTADRDSDDDGVPDLYDLRITCRDGVVSSSVVSSRHSLSGHGSSRQVAKPMPRPSGIEHVDHWTARTVGKPIAASWDLATAKGGRMAAGPKPITLVEVDPAVCSS